MFRYKLTMVIYLSQTTFKLMTRVSHHRNCQCMNVTCQNVKSWLGRQWSYTFDIIKEWHVGQLEPEN